MDDLVAALAYRIEATKEDPEMRALITDPEALTTAGTQTMRWVGRERSKSVWPSMLQQESRLNREIPKPAPYRRQNRIGNLVYCRRLQSLRRIHSNLLNDRNMWQGELEALMAESTPAKVQNIRSAWWWRFQNLGATIGAIEADLDAVRQQARSLGFSL